MQKAKTRRFGNAFTDAAPDVAPLGVQCAASMYKNTLQVRRDEPGTNPSSTSACQHSCRSKLMVIAIQAVCHPSPLVWLLAAGNGILYASARI